MGSRYGDYDKDDMYDEMNIFLRDHKLCELLEIVSDVSIGYETKNNLQEENERLKNELYELKKKIKIFKESVE